MKNKILNNLKHKYNDINMKNIENSTIIKLKYISNQNQGKKLRIFDGTFVKRNNMKYKIIYKSKKYVIKEYFEDIDKDYVFTDEEIISFKLVIFNKIIDTKCMFQGCDSLISLNILSKSNSFIISNMSCMFNGCIKLISLPDISEWNISNVKYMNGLFAFCTSLISLPNISNWNISNVKYINGIFAG